MMTQLLLALTLAASAPAAASPADSAAPAASPAPAAAAAASPEALLKQKATDVQALMGKKADAARKAELRTMVASVVDYTELAKASLKSRWEQRTEPERAEFTDLLRKLIEKSYLENIERQPDFTIEWKGEKLLKDGARAKVKTLATAGKITVEIEYRLIARPETATGWLVVDVVIDEVSMVRNYRRSFRKIIKNDGWPALIKKMKDKLAG